LSAGDIGNLNQDYSVAMRVTFKQADIPATSDLYWRGVLLADFDGKTWRRNLSPSISSPLNNTQKGLLATAINARSKPIYSYQIILEATGRQWLYGLNTLSVNNDKTTQLQDYTLVKTRPVVSRFQYDADSYPNVILSGQLSDQQKSVYTQLPQTEQSTSTAQLDNPRSLDYAKDLRRKYADPEEFIGALMQRFNEKFSYTLSPGKFSQTNAIDDFLFNQQRGYCEHFASSTAFLLRAAGIPARIAVGYQGGQWSNDKKYLQITQADAHAWVEVWIAGKGWKRLDPTAAVAPERVELGARSFLQSIAVHDSLANRFRHSGMMQQLGLRWDNVNYQWHRWVLGYNDQTQFSVVKSLLGGLDAWRIGALIFSILFIMILPLLLTFYWPRPREKPAKIFYCLTKLDKKLAKVGLQRESGETLSAFLDRACEIQIEHRDALAKICREANRLLYKHSSNVQSADCEGLARLINRLKIK
jgi:transglutaminase-like putative cysteine protease